MYGENGVNVKIHYKIRRYILLDNYNTDYNS